MTSVAYELPRRRRALTTILPAAALLAIVALGCGEALQTAEVDGVLLINDKPGHKILIQFIPDVDRGAKGPMSVSETDAEGRFKLQLMEGSGAFARPVAIVGWHRIVLSDLQLAESATGRGVPIRLDQRYTLPGSTPLYQEVTASK